MTWGSLGQLKEDGGEHCDRSLFFFLLHFDKIITNVQIKPTSCLSSYPRGHTVYNKKPMIQLHVRE